MPFRGVVRNGGEKKEEQVHKLWVHGTCRTDWLSPSYVDSPGLQLSDKMSRKGGTGQDDSLSSCWWMAGREGQILRHLEACETICRSVNTTLLEWVFWWDREVGEPQQADEVQLCSLGRKLVSKQAEKIIRPMWYSLGVWFSVFNSPWEQLLYCCFDIIIITLLGQANSLYTGRHLYLIPEW